MLEAMLPPPQELNRSTPAIREQSASVRRARLLSIPPIRAKPITAKVNIYRGEAGPAGFNCGCFSDAKAVLAEKVRTEVTEPEPGVTAAGENAQDRPTGRVEHESETALLNDPDLGATTMLEVTVWPAAKLTDDGEALRLTLAPVAGPGGGTGGGGTGQFAA